MGNSKIWVHMKRETGNTQKFNIKREKEGQITLRILEKALKNRFILYIPKVSQLYNLPENDVYKSHRLYHKIPRQGCPKAS